MGVEKELRCLSNSFSRFIHIVTFGVPKNLPCQKEYKDIAGSLKLFKRILDNIDDDAQIHSGEILHKEFEELDAAVNEAREFIENWGFHSSKICGVVQSRELIVKIRSYSIKICETVFRSLESSSPSSTSVLADIQHCMEELKSLKLEIASEKVEEAMEFIREGKAPPLQHLTEIIELLHLSSSQELLKESIAVEKENTMKVDQSNQVNHTVDLVCHIRETMVNIESSKSINGVSVPSYFICPLSLQLMSDPVIMASGQTYERDSITKWLDHGFRRCPVTRQPLSHTNLIPNYTVKALISNWCDENNVKVNRNVDHDSKPEYEQKVENGFEHRSPVESCSHSRTGSTSTAVSSSDYQHVSVSNSGEINSDSGFSPWVPDGGNRSYPRTVSLPLDSSPNDITTSSLIEHLVNDLKSDSNSAQTKAAAELRFLAKDNMENRIMIGQSGAIQPLLQLLKSKIKITQEHAVTALLNLSINGNIKSKIAESGAIDPLIHVLETGNPCAKENAAAALFSLSLLEDYRVKIGQSGAVKPLVDLLRSGTLRGKKDAATALFNLSIFHENKARIIQAGAVKYLVELMEPESEMVDKSVALLSNLSSVPEGCLAIAKENGIPLLVEVVESGTPRGKENAASILLQLCLGSPKYCRLVLQEGAVPPLVALSQSGTSRAKEKAQQLLSHFRSQRENASGRGK